MTLSISDNFGYHVFSDQHVKFHQANDASKFTGYFPLVGTITGIVKLILCITGMKSARTEDRPCFYVFMARAVIEILFLGVLFLIPDLIFTIGRTIRDRQYILE